MTRTPSASARRPSRRGLTLVLALPALMLLGGATVPLLSAGTSRADTLAVKPAISGLIDRQQVPSPAAQAYVNAYVVKVSWADLQPTAFGPIAADNAIDKAIARVRMPDLAGKMSLKLRVLAGINAPAWAKAIGGAPLPYLDNQPGSVKGGTIGRFWLPAYGAAYADLQAKLAAKYDAVPEIREVVVDRCSTIFDELFVRQPGVPANIAALKGAGYTTAADEACISQAISAHQVWTQTISDVDFSPFPLVLTHGTDLAFTLASMDFCRATLGLRCGLENNGLASSKLTDKNFVAMYGHMKQLGAPITFQTATTGRIGDWQAALQAGLAYGAGSIELPYGYTSWPVSDLMGMQQRFPR